MINITVLVPEIPDAPVPMGVLCFLANKCYEKYFVWRNLYGTNKF
jgi:hypothetical protein